MKTVKASYIFSYILALLWEKQPIQARVMQEQQEIFVHDILRTMTSEYLPTYMYLEQVMPCYSPWYLAVLNYNSFVYMELKNNVRQLQHLLGKEHRGISFTSERLGKFYE